MLQFLTAWLLVSAVLGVSDCDSESCTTSHGLLQRHSFASEKANLGDDEIDSPGSPVGVSSSEGRVVESVKVASRQLQDELAAKCGGSPVTIAITLLGDPIEEVEDGMLVEFSAQIKGSSAGKPDRTVYHTLKVLWEMTQNGQMRPVLHLPDDVAWCNVLDKSSNDDLALLANDQGHAAVVTYHQMLGYLGDSQGMNPDALVQEQRASCKGSTSLPAEYNPRYDSTHKACFERAAVNNQGGCGSCWAFAAAHAVTARLCMQNQADIINNADGNGRRFVSVQDVLSCSSGKQGCKGGWMSSAFEEWKRGGAPLARDYVYSPGGKAFPWHRQGASCKWGLYMKPYRVSSYYSVARRSVNEMQKELFCNGPFTVAFRVYNNFFGYKSGVYTGPASGKVAGGHAVVAVGWGTLSGTDYWEIMNSWGSGWGDGGFVKFLRGKNLALIESWGLQAAKVERTQASWVYEDWGNCSGKKTNSSGSQIQYGDRFIQIGDWRIGDVDGAHFSMAHKGGRTAVIYRSDGTVHGGPRRDFTTWGRSIGAASGISFGDRFIQIGEWRIGEVDGKHASIAHKGGRTAEIWRLDGTIHRGPRRDFTTWGRSIGKASGIQIGDRFIQLGDWRIGDVDGRHASIAHKGGKTALIFRSDGTLHSGPRSDFTTWSKSTKSRGIKCVDNSGSGIIDAAKCPRDRGWPNPASFPAQNARAAAEMEPSAIKPCSDDGSKCTRAVCNGNGAAVETNGKCTCRCSAGFAGANCEQCSSTHQGYPTCRESCTRAADCNNRGTASGVKWKNEFGAVLDNCACLCDHGFKGPTCKETLAPTTLAPTTLPPTPTTQPPVPTTTVTTTVADVIIPVEINASEIDSFDIKVTIQK